MRRWGHHRTRSKVTLLLLINLVTLLGGKYTALLTLMKSELFGETLAVAKAPKKKPPKPHLSRAQRDHHGPPPTTQTLASAPGKRRSPHTLLHVMRRGDTLTEIAHAYGISVDALRRANRLSPARHVGVGETLRIPPSEGPQDMAARRQTFHASARSPLAPRQRHVARHTPAPMPAHQALLWPVQGPLTSPFGERDHVMGGGGTQFHAGIDLSVPTGTPVRAVQEGTVVFAADHGAYGKAVKLEHAHGLSTLYAHNSRLVVQVGQTVKAGQVICLSGSTGRSTGPHLHFEVHNDGWPVDPLLYLQ